MGIPSHVVAATILFNRRHTLGAFLGVGRDPVCRLGVVFALFEPLFDQYARTRLVIVVPASEAEAETAIARHGGNDLVQFRLAHLAVDGVFAIRCWAPSQVWLVVDVGPVQELAISKSIAISSEILLEAG